MSNVDNHGQVDAAASQACTKAGTFALLVSVFLFMLTIYWHDRRNDEALGKYVLARWNLALYLDNLDKDQLWTRYKELHPAAELSSLDTLRRASLKIRVEATGAKTLNSNSPDFNPAAGSQGAISQQSHPPITKSPSSKQPASRPDSPKLSQGPFTPAAPTGLQATMESTIEIYQVAHIIEHFKELNDPDTLEGASNVNNFFGLSIAKWVDLRGTTIYGNAVTGFCSVTQIEVPSTRLLSKRSSPLIDENALLQCVTLHNLRELSAFEYPSPSNPIDLGSRIIREPNFSLGSLPHDPFAASLASELLMGLVLFYFAAFAREATISKDFPVRGTLFGAFSNSNSQRRVFLLAVWIPFIACLTTAIASWNILIALGTVPVLIATLSIQEILESHSFFRDFRPVSDLRVQVIRVLNIKSKK